MFGIGRWCVCCSYRYFDKMHLCAKREIQKDYTLVPALPCGKNNSWMNRSSVFRHLVTHAVTFCWGELSNKNKAGIYSGLHSERGGSVDTSPRQRHRRPAPHHWAWPCVLHGQSLCCFKNFRLVSPPSSVLRSDRSVFLCSELDECFRGPRPTIFSHRYQTKQSRSQSKFTQQIQEKCVTAVFKYYSSKGTGKFYQYSKLIYWLYIMFGGLKGQQCSSSV